MAALTDFNTTDATLIINLFPSTELIAISIITIANSIINLFPSTELIAISVNMVLDSLIVIGLNHPEDVVRISDTQ